MRRILLLIAATGVMASAVGTFSAISDASCAGPTVKTVKAAEPGDVIVVHGMYWAAECNDTESCTVGCGGEECSGGEKSPPYTNLRISLAWKTAEGTWQYGILANDIDAHPESYRVQVEVTLPENVPPGRYRVTMGNVDSGTYRSQVLVIE